MQRLLSPKQASLSAFTSSCSPLLHSLPYKTFSSVANPTPQNHFISSAFSNQWRSKPCFTGETQGCWICNQEVHDYFKTLCPDLHITRGEYDEDSRYPENKTLTIGQFKLGICHGHQRDTMIVVATMTIHNFIRKLVGRNYADFMKYEDINWAYENTIDSENAHGRESDDNDDDDDGGDDDGESSNLSGFEMELTRDVIASSLMNSL